MLIVAMRPENTDILNAYVSICIVDYVLFDIVYLKTRRWFAYGCCFNVIDELFCISHELRSFGRVIARLSLSQVPNHTTDVSTLRGKMGNSRKGTHWAIRPVTSRYAR